MPRPKKVVDNTPKTVDKVTEEFIAEEIVNKEFKMVTAKDELHPGDLVKEVIVEKIVIKEIIKEVEKPRLEGYELYAKLRDINYPQGGSGQYMENPSNIDKVYIPTAQEVISFFIGDPDKWEQMRDHIIRAYIEINEDSNR